jgi:hypothetical protein
MAKLASAAPSFESILDTPIANVDRPQPIPVGTYDVIVRGMYEQGVSNVKKTPFVQFAFAITAAGDDVDPDALEAIGGLSDKVFKNNSTKFYTTPDSLWRLTDALEAMGIDDLDTKTVRQALAETPNSACKILITHVTSEDGSQTFAELKKILPAD